MTAQQHQPSGRSALRCRPGDMAIIVKPGMAIADGAAVHMDLSGRVVQLNGVLHTVLGPAWCVTSYTGFAHGTAIVLDEHLRPLRGGLGVDQTLLWAGPPPSGRQQDWPY